MAKLHVYFEQCRRTCPGSHAEGRKRMLYLASHPNPRADRQTPSDSAGPASAAECWAWTCPDPRRPQVVGRRARGIRAKRATRRMAALAPRYPQLKSVRGAGRQHVAIWKDVLVMRLLLAAGLFPQRSVVSGGAR